MIRNKNALYTVLKASFADIHFKREDRYWNPENHGVNI